MPKVLIADALSSRAAEILAARGIAVDFLPGLPADELKDRIAGYDGLAVRSATKVTKGLLAHAGNLRVIGRAGIGVDNIDVDAATQRGIVVMNTPYGNSITAAEHTIAMLFALCRQIPAADRSDRQHRCRRGHTARHRRHEHPLREFDHRGRAHDRNALRAVPADPGRRPIDPSRQV